VIRIGTGYDAHKFKPGSSVVLGGVTIPYDRSLDGHSDADVLTHAIMDAVLGAAGGPDIGVLFPNNEPAYRGISSIELANRVRAYVLGKGYRIVQIDSTLIAEGPKISAHRAELAANIAAALGISPEDAGIKATTNEGMGFVGRGEGMAAIAVAQIEIVTKVTD